MASGGVNSWPDYMQYQHAWWLGGYDADLVGGDVTDRTETFHVDADINTARGRNPFNAVASYDPSSILAEIESELSDFNTIAESLDPTADYKQAMLDALSVIPYDLSEYEPDDLTIEPDIDNAIDAYENKITPEHLREVGRLAAQLQNSNAVRGSFFAFSMIDIERKHADKVLDFRDKLRLEFEGLRIKYRGEKALQTQKLGYEFMVNGAGDILRGSLSKVALYGDVLAKQIDIGKTKIVAYKEQNDMQITLDAKKVTWDLDLYAYGGNLLAAQSGGVYKTAADASTLEKWVSGVLGTAAQVGDIIGTVKDIFSDKK